MCAFAFLPFILFWFLFLSLLVFIGFVFKTHASSSIAGFEMEIGRKWERLGHAGATLDSCAARETVCSWEHKSVFKNT